MTSRGRILRLHHVSLGTTNLPRALDFYSAVLGGEIAHEFRNDAGELYGAFLHYGHGTFVELFRADQAVAAADAAFRHSSFEVADIEAAAAALRAHGFTPEVRRGRTDKVLQLFIEDPDGNKVELQQHDGQSTLTRFLESRQPAGRRGLAGRIALGFLGALFALGIAELALRIAVPNSVPGLQFRMIDGIGSNPTLAPQNSVLRQRSFWSNYDVEVRTGEYGLRERKAFKDADASSIFVTGDQFAFGAGVAEDERFSNLLERRLGMPVYNISMRGILPWGHFKLVRYAEEIAGYAKEADVRIGRLVLVLSSSQDVQRYQDMAKTSASPTPPAAPGVGSEPFGAVLMRHSALLQEGRRLIFTYGLSKKRGVLHMPVVYPVLRSVQDMISPRSNPSVPPDHDEAVRQTVVQLGKIAGLRDTLFIVTPAPQQFMPDERNPDTGAVHARMHNAFVDALSRSGLAFVDLAPAFAKIPTGAAAFPHDLAWTAAAHAAAADAMAPVIKQKWNTRAP